MRWVVAEELFSRVAGCALIVGLGLPSLPANVYAESKSQYIPYPVDLKPMEKYPELNAEWQKNKLAYTEIAMPEAVLKRQLEIISTMSARESGWNDGLWMISDVAFQLAASYTDEKDLPFARSVFVRGEKAAEKCLQRQADHPICKLLLGAMIGKIASIDGIFSSLKKAKLVEGYWLDVTHSKYNHKFTESSSLQGSARYALGMFYRLVPDFFLMKWLFDVRGDIQKSIQYHRDAIVIDPPNPCNKIMLAASLLCSVKGDLVESEGKEALRHLREARQLTAKSIVSKACQNDSIKLERTPGNACGYETARQQEGGSEEDLKKQSTAH